MNRRHVALALGGAHCDVNYSSFWRILVGGHLLRPPHGMATQKRFDFPLRPLDGRRGMWTSGYSMRGRAHITAS
jgi:hypothetical protein